MLSQNVALCRVFLAREKTCFIALCQRLGNPPFRRGGGKPDPPKGASSPGSRFSEKERAEPPESKQSNKCSKLDRIPIDREQVLKLDRATLPPDAEFKDYKEVVVQELHIRTDNVRFRKEKYCSFP